MKLRKWEAFEASLTIVGDEARLPRSVEAAERYRRRLDRQNEWERRRMATDPVYAERRRAYHRDWMRAYRETPQRPVAALHSLKCTGSTRREGCVCHKITLYSGPAK